MVDEPIVARRIKRYQKAMAEIYKADTIADLAKQMGVPVETLESTVKEFNAAVHNGTTDKLAVPTTLEKPYTIEKAPFYGFMFAGGMTATFGGPKINPKAQIINTEGQPIPGLYGSWKRCRRYLLRQLPRRFSINGRRDMGAHCSQRSTGSS